MAATPNLTSTFNRRALLSGRHGLGLAGEMKNIPASAGTRPGWDGRGSGCVGASIMPERAMVTRNHCRSPLPPKITTASRRTPYGVKVRRMFGTRSHCDGSMTLMAIRAVMRWRAARWSGCFRTGGGGHFVFTTRRGLPLAVRALIDHLVATFPADALAT